MGIEYDSSYELSDAEIEMVVRGDIGDAIVSFKRRTSYAIDVANDAVYHAVYVMKLVRAAKEP